MSISVADRNSEIPARRNPPRKLRVRLLIAPADKGPTKPPRLPIELIRAIPAAAENPDKNSFGSDQKGPYKLKIPAPAKHSRKTEKKAELMAVVVPSNSRKTAAIIAGMAAW